MYDGLIERLRTHAKSYEDMFGKGESSVMMRDAADAIEELSMKLHGDEAAIAGMKREIERMVVIDADKDRAIEDLTRQRDRAYARLCEWCGACQPDKRNPEDCEIAAIGPDYTIPEPPKEES